MIEFNDKNIIILEKLMEAFASNQSDIDFYISIHTDAHSESRKIYLSDEDLREDFLNNGLSILEVCMHFASSVEGGIIVRETVKLIEKLESSGILIQEDPMRTRPRKYYKTDSVRYKITPHGVKMLNDGLIHNAIFGFPYIIKKNKDTIVKVLGKNIQGDQIMGTAFILNTKGKRQIVTCRHNVDRISDLRFDVEGQIFTNFEIHCHVDCQVDCVLIDCDGLPNVGFVLQEEVHLLEEVITMGFPTIPRSGDAYLMVHKGEVNGVILDYQNNEKKIIFSAKTSSGNSGSPLINEFGEVIGIVANELFDKDAYIDKGKPPYYAAIPIKNITEIPGYG